MPTWGAASPTPRASPIRALIWLISTRSASSQRSTVRVLVRSTGSPNFRIRASAAARRVATSGSSRSSSPAWAPSSGSTSNASWGSVAGAWSAMGMSLGKLRRHSLGVYVNADTDLGPRGGGGDAVHGLPHRGDRGGAIRGLDHQLSPGPPAEPEQRRRPQHHGARGPQLCRQY